MSTHARIRERPHYKAINSDIAPVLSVKYKPLESTGGKTLRYFLDIGATTMAAFPLNVHLLVRTAG